MYPVTAYHMNEEKAERAYNAFEQIITDKADTLEKARDGFEDEAYDCVVESLEANGDEATHDEVAALLADDDRLYEILCNGSFSDVLYDHIREHMEYK